MLLGYARGKVGSMVFSRSAGEQITRAYNGSPRNDRTEPQMNQRTKFLSANKFFTHGQQAFFKFAYEDKRQNESDFNAFMRNNVKNGLMMSKAAFEENTYPSVGEWLVTKGSLPGINLVYYSGEDPQLPKFIVGPASQGDQGSVAHLSKDLVRYYGVQEGDIITILCIIAEGSDSNNTPSVNPGMRQRIRWIINQFTIDTNSILRISDIMQDGVGFFIHQASDQWGLIVPDSVSNIAGACISVSRKTRRGLKVSTTKIVNNAQGRNAISTGLTDTYKKAVRVSWQTSTRAVLEGTMGSTPYDIVGFMGFRGIGSGPERAADCKETSIGQKLSTVFDSRTNEPCVYFNCKNFNALDDTLLTENSRQLFLIRRWSGVPVIQFDLTPDQEYWPLDYDVLYNGTKIFTVPAYYPADTLMWTLNGEGIKWLTINQRWTYPGATPRDWDVEVFIPEQYSDSTILSHTWSVLVNGVAQTLSLEISRFEEDNRIKRLSMCHVDLVKHDTIIIQCDSKTLFEGTV